MNMYFATVPCFITEVLQLHTEELWKDGPRLIQSEGVFRLGTDAVLIADYAAGFAAKTACDIGCGSGVISILMAARNERLKIDAIELSETAAGLAEENARINKLEDRINVTNADIRNHREYLKAGAYDLVICNPPYFPVNSGKTSANEKIAKARGEQSCTLADVCTAAGYLTRWGGHFFVVHRPQRLAELILLMSESGIEPKRMRTVAHRVGDRPSVILMEGIRGAKPGMNIEPVLYLTDSEGKDSEEVKRIYRR